MEERLVFELKTPRTGEETPEAMVQFLASFTNLLTSRYRFFKRGIPFSLELAVQDQSVHFYMTVPESYGPFAVSQMSSQYPKASILKQEHDYLPALLQNRQGQVGQLLLRHNFLLPLRSYTEFSDVDPLSSLLGILSKAQKDDTVVIQFLIVPTPVKWHGEGERAMNKKTKKADGTEEANPHAAIIGEKIKQHGFQVGIRLFVKSETPTLFKQVATTFSSFNNPSGNSLHLKKPPMWNRSAFYEAMSGRSARFIPKRQILNLSEIATMYHMPGLNLSKLTNITWTKKILSEAPENIPISEGLDEEQKHLVNFFARTEFKNEERVFGIKKEDRRRHMYVIGKTGTGKSTLIANMVINDMRNGAGMAVIDPHGDLVESILDYVPKSRINDVVYLNPADTEATFRLNLLESTPEQKDLVASGIVAIFHKLYAESWGPRLEYILRNTILALLELPDANLLMVPKMLADAKYRKKVVPTIKDPIIRSFWENEFEQMRPQQQSEAISPILNKVGQFLSSGKIRNIVGHSKSTVDLEEAMNTGKIVLFNLSQGKIGEDSAALLGAMTITKLQLSAMNRVNVSEEERRDFYLYVDEFQNFATNSFIKILSEARKYRLNLVLANQYMAQLSPELKSAIFGNVGTLMSFIVGAEDMEYLAHEFGERFTTEDILSLGNHQGLLKLAIDGITSAPFHAYTLPLPRSINQNKEKVLRISRERYGKSDEDPGEPVLDLGTSSQSASSEHSQMGSRPYSSEDEAVKRLERQVAQLKQQGETHAQDKPREQVRRDDRGRPAHQGSGRNDGPSHDRSRPPQRVGDNRPHRDHRQQSGARRDNPGQHMHRQQQQTSRTQPSEQRRHDASKAPEITEKPHGLSAQSTPQQPPTVQPKQPSQEQDNSSSLPKSGTLFGSE